VEFLTLEYERLIKFAVFVAGANFGAVAALFAAHKLNGPLPRFPVVRGTGRAQAPSRAKPVSEPIVDAALLASLPKPLVVSDVQVLPGRSGWGRPSVAGLNVGFAQLADDDGEPEPPLPDEQRTIDGGDDDYPYGLLHDTTAPPSCEPLTAADASRVRRGTREGGAHRASQKLLDADTGPLPVESVQRVLRGAA
jgi:hypothetical protein